jgi:hypothetical protein
MTVQFIASTGRLSLKPGDSLRVLILNPKNSGIRATLESSEFLNLSPDWQWVSVIVGPTTGLPAGSDLVPLPRIIGPAPASVLRYRFDVADKPMDGGESVRLLPLGPGGVTDVLHGYPAFLPDGQTFGYNISWTGTGRLPFDGWWFFRFTEEKS